MRLRRRARNKVVEGFSSYEEMVAFHARCEQLVAENRLAGPPIDDATPGSAPADDAAVIHAMPDDAAVIRPAPTDADVVAWSRTEDARADADDAASA